MSSKARMDVLPILALMATALFWGLLWYPLRWLAEHGLPGLWATEVLFTSALLLGSPLLWRYRGELALRPGLLVGLALTNGWCNTAFILAVLDGQVVRVMLLFYLSPVWAVLLARLLLGERLPSLALVTLALAMGGGNHYFMGSYSRHAVAARSRRLVGDLLRRDLCPVQCIHPHGGGFIHRAQDSDRLAGSDGVVGDVTDIGRRRPRRVE